MTLLIDDPMESLKRKAMIFILGIMVLGGVLTTILHTFESQTHLISLIIPPLTAIICSTLLVYLLKYPHRIYRVTQLVLIWSGFIILFPEYFFVIEAFVTPGKRLVDILPPLSSGPFLLTISTIVFLRPRALVKVAVLLWLITASPIVIYLVLHPQELETPRGMDLLVTLVPAMSMNLALVLFYSRLQDIFNKIHIERLHFKEASEKDALTGAFNRGAGEKILQKLIDQSNQRIGIILCDIDRFKHINDNYGHLMGDRVLQLIARCCQLHLRKQDTLIRWGGEEFMIIVTGDSENELKYLAERLRGVIAAQQIPEVGSVTASFGVALLSPQESLSQLFARADQALYQAKGSGRNQVIFA